MGGKEEEGSQHFDKPDPNYNKPPTGHQIEPLSLSLPTVGRPKTAADHHPQHNFSRSPSPKTNTHQSPKPPRGGDLPAARHTRNHPAVERLRSRRKPPQGEDPSAARQNRYHPAVVRRESPAKEGETGKGSPEKTKRGGGPVERRGREYREEGGREGSDGTEARRRSLPQAAAARSRF